MTNLQFLSNLLKDKALYTWTNAEKQEINNLPSFENLEPDSEPYKFIYDKYNRVIILLNKETLADYPNFTTGKPYYQSNGVQIWNNENAGLIQLGNKISIHIGPQ